MRNAIIIVGGVVAALGAVAAMGCRRSGAI